MNSLIELDGNFIYRGPYDGLYGNKGQVLGFENLQFICGDLKVIGDDPTILLQNIKTVDGTFEILNTYSDNFTNLNFLSNLTNIGGNLIVNNTRLSNYCALQKALQKALSNAFSELLSIDNNSYNPTLLDILDDKCSQ